MKKVLLVLFATIICLVSSVFIGNAEETIINPVSKMTPDWLIENTEEHITLIDYAGREVTISKPVERIIPMTGSLDLLLLIKALKAEDKVIAIVEGEKDTDEAEILFPEMNKLPSCGGCGSGPNPTINYEKIFELKPDIVITWSFVPEEFNEMLEPEITVIHLEFSLPFERYFEDVEKLGYILDKQDEAAEYLDWCKGAYENITNRVAELSKEDKPRVFEFYGGDWGLTDGPPYGTYGKENYWVGPLIESAGGNNIAGDLPGDWITVDAEWVADKNPSIIIREVFPSISGPIVGYGVDDSSKVATMRVSIMNQPEFAYTGAAIKNNFYLCEGSIIQGQWFIGLQYLAKWFHPDLFEDLDPQAFHQEYLNRFLNIDYDLDKHGVFVYPK
jgi:iron complex transport system substrate-binding protein